MELNIMTQTCINCGRTDDQVPLLGLTFRGRTEFLCPQCLPILIHEPEKLESKLPGLEARSAAHDDG